MKQEALKTKQSTWRENTEPKDENLGMIQVEEEINHDF